MRRNKLMFYSFIAILLILSGLGTYMVMTTVVLDDPADNNGENNNGNNSNNNEDMNNTTDENAESINGSVVEEDYDNLYREFINNTETNITRDETLDSIARYKSDDMAENEYLSAESPSGEKIRDIFEREGVTCDIYGVNIASTFYNKTLEGDKKYTTSGELANGIFDEYTSDEDNSENLIRDGYDKYGVGVSITENNKVYHTQVFCG